MTTKAYPIGPSCPWPKAPGCGPAKKRKRAREEVTIPMGIALEVMEYTARHVTDIQRAREIYLGAMISVIEETLAESPDYLEK